MTAQSLKTRLQQPRQPRLPDQLVLNHGPREQLGRFFLEADKAARDRGVFLSLSTDFELLREVNAHNQGSWHGLAPSFDCAYGGIDRTCGFWLIGRDESGAIVTTQAARFFDMGSDSLADYLTSLRLFYPRPAEQKLAEESCIVASEAAAQIGGRVVYSGGTWIHPEYRKRQMPMILPRISRALALTLWDTDYTFSMVSHALVSKGVAAAYGYRNVEPGIRWMNSATEIRLEGTLVWMGREELLADMLAFGLQFGSADAQPQPAPQPAATGHETPVPLA
jgi:hypothetical protein